MANIAFYGSHNAALSIEEDGEFIVTIELERFLNKKNAGYSQYKLAQLRRHLMPEILHFIEKEYGIKHFETCYHLNTETSETPEEGKVVYAKTIPADNYNNSALHHKSHAAGAFYQTDYDQALIISFDGGGNDGFFNVYHAENRDTITLISNGGQWGWNLDLGFAYMSFGDYLSDIRREIDLNEGNLVYSGKIMGLCSYGELNEEWLTYFENYYERKPNGLNYLDFLKDLEKETGLVFDKEKRLEGKLSWDVAKTSQIAFENIFLKNAEPYLKQRPDMPLLLSGGCALNILLNTKLKESLGREVFIPPNPNDCGLSSGMMLDIIKPRSAVDLTYAGIPILDRHLLGGYAEEKFATKINDVNPIIKDLMAGHIVGVVRGNSEVGPRALGNRSIICDPTRDGMKDILNEKVKNREWYRPFAPVCRLEDVSKYFEFEGESRWMSFCPKVREEWRDKLVSITHVDGTARVQTVTKSQNPWLYDLLTELDNITGVGVILNTSFNVNGKPILSTYVDAIKVFNETQMDRLLLEDFYFKKGM